MLNHASADTSPDLDTQSATTIPSPDICEDERTVDEDQKAIRKLKNDRAAGHDGILPGLLKYSEEPVSRALHELFRKAEFPSSGRKASLFSCTRETARETNAQVNGRYPSQEPTLV